MEAYSRLQSKTLRGITPFTGCYDLGRLGLAGFPRHVEQSGELHYTLILVRRPLLVFAFHEDAVGSDAARQTKCGEKIDLLVTNFYVLDHVETLQSIQVCYLVLEAFAFVYGEVALGA